MLLPSLLRSQFRSLSWLPKHHHLSFVPLPHCASHVTMVPPTQYPSPVFRASHGAHAAKGALPATVFLLNTSSFFNAQQS